MTTEKLLSSSYANEDQMTALYYQWVNHNYPSKRKLIFHVPNGGARNKIEGSKFKSMGLVPGVPDFVCVSPLWGLELKMPTGTQSADQKTIQTMWTQNQVDYSVAFTMQDAVNMTIERFGQPNF